MISSLKLTVSAAALALLLGGCATPRPDLNGQSPSDQVLAELNDLETHASSAQAGMPAEVLSALLPPVSRELPPVREHRFDIDVHEVDARTFFLSLLSDSGANIVVHPSVSGTLTLSLRNVTVADTLEAVRDVFGYDIRRSATGWQVFPATMQSRMFNVNYINLTREGRTETRVSSGQLRSGENGDEGSGPAASQIATSSRSHFWEELESSLQLIVSSVGDEAVGRAVVVNPHTGIVLIRAMPAELREVERFLHSLQSSITRQVLLEARILEVELSDGFQTGINWAALGRPGRDKTIVGGMTGGGSLFRDGTSDLSGQTGVLDPSQLAQVGNTLTSAFGGAFSAALNLNDFTAFIELLKSQGDVQVLSSPRIATMNNQKAVIKVGSDEFFVTKVSSNNTTTGTTTNTNPEIELTPFFSGIALDVTPQIDDNGDIILHVRPAVSEVVDQTKTLTVFGQAQTLPLAFSSTRESDSIVRARNGQIVVIGGLMQDVQREERAGMPVLGDLPVIGSAFRHTRQSRRKTELVILLRPVVVDSDQVWRDDLRGTATRIERLPPPSFPLQ